MRSDEPIVLTVGHSTYPIGKFIKLLEDNGVTAIADVRSMPYSRYNPQFNREDLEAALKQHGIRYVFLGRELGARSDDPSCYENGRVIYRRLAQTELFQSGLQRVIRGAQDYRIALMCAEKEPLECHRTLLVAQELVAQSVTVQHILSNGRLEAHEATLERLLDMFDLRQLELFDPLNNRLADALARQEARIAYVDERIAADSTGELS